jgi:iron complex transport system substrate-binding protein
MKKLFLPYLLFTCSIFISQYLFASEELNRIAIAGGSITEIVYQLGEEHRIVGVDSTSQFPVAAKQHPLLGYVRNISAEGVLSLQPDLLIGEADTGPTKVVNQIKATGIKTVIIEEDDTIPAIKDKIRLIAQLLNTKDKGERLIEAIQVDIDALNYAKRYLAKKNIDSFPRVLFLLSVANGAPIAAGHSTSAHTAITEAGGINVLAKFEGWEKLSPEAALALKPEVIVVMNRDQGDVLKQLRTLPHFKYSPAIKNDRVYSINGNYLLGFGPRTPQAIVELGTLIHTRFPLPVDYRFRFPNQSTVQTAGH